MFVYFSESNMMDYIMRLAGFCKTMLLIALFSLSSNAQDSHYWTPKYGTESTLLGGAVVGSHLDISSTFYNPGALSISDNQAFVSTGWVFNVTSLHLESAAGHENDIGSLHLSPAPDYVTTLVPSDSKNKFAFTFLNRYKFEERLSARTSFKKDVLHQPGDELFAGDYYVDQRVKENWAGVTWSREVTNRVGLGVSNFVAFRSQNFRSDIHTQALSAEKYAAQNIKTRHTQFYNFRLLWKIGLAADFSPLKLGLSVTTPSINVWGKGSSYINTSLSGMVIANYDGHDVVEFDDQANLTSTFHSPLSIALGGSYTINKTTLHASFECFNDVDEYQVLPTTPFISQATEAQLENPVIQKLEAITNFGFGIQQVRSEQLEIYASFVTDFSAVSPGSSHNMSLTTWNIYHVMAGVLLRVWRSEFTAGVGYSYGQDRIGQKVDFNSAHEDNLLMGELGKANGSYKNLTLLAGFSIFPTELFEKTLDGLPFFRHKK
jgi:hypothetical protein